MKLAFCSLILILTFSLTFCSAVFAQTEHDKGIELYKKKDYKGAVNNLKKASKRLMNVYEPPNLAT